jgi:hypothetical protein
MIAATTRLRAVTPALATLLLGVASPLALYAQAASITMPKQSAQRAAAASNRRLESQITQAHGPQSPGPAGASRPQLGGRQAGAAPTSPRQGQGTPPGTGVVQSGGTRAAGAPDPAHTIMREVFEYSAGGRRDPFFSLMATGDLRPMLSDLRLTTILYDPTGRRPVAVMNDVTTNLQYRVTTGMMLGRMRVTQIRPRKVIFAIEEFGFSRADSLALADKPQPRQ